MIDDQKLSSLKDSFGFSLVLVNQSSHIKFRVPYRRIDGAVIGRIHTQTRSFPTVDLTPLNAMASGVSRQHAKFTLRENRVWITDMASCNGTFINGKRIVSGIEIVLRQGDHIRLGHLKLEVRFE